MYLKINNSNISMLLINALPSHNSRNIICGWELLLLLSALLQALVADNLPYDLINGTEHICFRDRYFTGNIVL